MDIFTPRKSYFCYKIILFYYTLRVLIYIEIITYLHLTYASNTSKINLEGYDYKPFQLKRQSAGKKVHLPQLEDIKDCNCPRIYYPVCATNKVTYANGCIMRCLGKSLNRYGPCIIY